MPIDITSYLQSITEECNALKNRVRHLIEDRHWATDGAWKESVLRALISRTLPSNYSVASGFVVTDSGPSTQIDVLIYDNTLPVLYKGGDLVFVPPAACVGIIEVKSSLNSTGFRQATVKLADNCGLVRRYETEKRLFSGIFAFEGNGTPGTLLEHIDAAAQGQESRIVNHVSIGPSTFIKYWPTHPESGQAHYRHWHHYEVEQMAPGYFVHNLMSFLAGENLVRGNNIWFPREGKEGRRVHARRFTERPADIAA
ncbi:DUF6602 domain-containing protein [Cupriavidus basilensis]|uniref:DUF6602 domain-containing protein n=1 Tax=Cupriavidus basilensis TaxID=68895 RepID=A0A643FJV4_9BURK|nr:DUF6602 domain-containing protein [Cupriavidus basilensis]QOT76324.1 hypothetical protein F7R26_019710 [Cupriavidus basilensis]